MENYRFYDKALYEYFWMKGKTEEDAREKLAKKTKSRLDIIVPSHDFKGLTFEELAAVVADDFRQSMKEEGFETFQEMKECYWWTWKEIKTEVDYIVTHYGEDHHVSIYMWDDMSHIEINSRLVSWKEFKKLVDFGNL